VKENIVLKNMLWMVLEKSIRLVIAVAISGMMARSLGPADFGVLNYYISLLTIVSVFSSLGLNRIIVREVASGISDVNYSSQVIATAFYLRLIVSFALWVIIVSMSLMFFNNEVGYIVVIFASLFFTSFDVYDFYAQGMSEFKSISASRLISFIITSILKLILVINHYGLMAFMILVFFEFVLVAASFYIFFIRFRLESIMPKNVSVLRAVILVKESWPEIIAGFGAILFMRLDQICLQTLSGSSSVGIYSAATRITEAWYFLPTAITAATFPKLVALREVSEYQYMSGIRLLTSALVFISIFVAILFSVFSNLIVNIVFGADYIDSADVIVLHTWGAIFLCMGISSGSWLVVEKKLKLNLFRNVFGLCVSALANVTLIPLYGVNGSAFSTVLGLASAFYLFDIFHPTLRPMFILKTKSLLPLYLFRYLKTIK